MSILKSGKSCSQCVNQTSCNFYVATDCGEEKLLWKSKSVESLLNREKALKLFLIQAWNEGKEVFETIGIELNIDRAETIKLTYMRYRHNMNVKILETFTGCIW